MTYKPEVDGLRAVAVLLVLFCHLDLGFPGGYIGVDVFFVISGFLITFIIINDNQFSFIKFYIRRILRLYPALIVVVLLTCIICFLIADPFYLKNTIKTAIYALFSISNIYYYKHQNYFDVSADQQTFLHTWSLGVEWQFYLLWPFIIIFLIKYFKKYFYIVIFIITICSVFLSEYILKPDQAAAYYLLPFRIFELSLGTLLIFLYDKKIRSFFYYIILILGIIFVLSPAIIYEPPISFPGTAALLPCLGAVGCIWGAQHSIAGKIFRLKFLVYIGKISYSLYLVHWPLILIYKYYIFRDLYVYDKLILILISILISGVLYKFVEKKYNVKKFSINSVNLFKSALKFLCLILMLVFINNGVLNYSWRVDTEKYMLSEYRNSDTEEPENLISVFGDSDGIKVAVLMGDSQIGHLKTGLNDTLRNSGKFVDAIYYPGCFMSSHISTTKIIPRLKSLCFDRYSQAVNDVLESGVPLVVAQGWYMHFSVLDRRMQDQDTGAIFTVETDEEMRSFLFKHFDDVHRDIRGGKLVLLGLPPYYRWGTEPLSCMLRPNFVYQICQERVGSVYDVKDTYAFRINEILRTYASTHPNVYFVDVSDILCPEGLCHADQTTVIFGDSVHYSWYGSKLVAPFVMQVIEAVNQED